MKEALVNKAAEFASRPQETLVRHAVMVKGTEQTHFVCMSTFLTYIISIIRMKMLSMKRVSLDMWH